MSWPVSPRARGAGDLRPARKPQPIGVPPRARGRRRAHKKRPLAPVVGAKDIQQIPRSLRRNGLPVKRIDGTLLMRHESLAGSPVKLMEGAETAPRSNRVLHHPPEAFERVAVMAAGGGEA